MARAAAKEMSKVSRVDHSFLDRRSLAFHVVIAEKLRSNPRLLGKVRNRLRVLMRDSSVSISVRDAYREWLLFIEWHSFDEVLALMVDPSEEGKRLRQARAIAKHLGFPRESTKRTQVSARTRTPSLYAPQAGILST
jgi:hypothetical protein